MFGDGVGARHRSGNVEGADWLCAGQVDYDRLRPLFYPDACVLILCFDVTNPCSFHNISSRVGVKHGQSRGGRGQFSLAGWGGAGLQL